MIVNRDIDLIFVAEVVEHLKGIFGRLSDDGDQSELFREIKNLPRLLRLVGSSTTP